MFLLTVFICLLLLTNAYFLYKYLKYRYKLRQKGLFTNWPLPKISLDQLDQVFHPNEFGPTSKAEVRFIGKGNLVVPGGTSDTEAWILSALSKNSMNIFEFGTCTGKTTYLMAVNSNADARVTTLTLAPEMIGNYNKSVDDSSESIQDALNESVFKSFLYSDTTAEKKITQLFADSKGFDETPYEGKMDLIFIDGSHAYSYVISDSEKALKMIAPNGLILWHDYRGPRETRDVFKALNQLSKKIPIKHIRETSLAVYRHPSK